MQYLVHTLRIAGTCLCVAAVAAGCGKKADQAQTPTETEAPQTAAPATPGTPGATPTATAATAAVQANYAQAMAQAEAARQARDYERAVQATLALGQAQRTEQQSLAARDQMIRLQSDLAAAAAAGDPKAVAAIEALRRSRMR